MCILHSNGEWRARACGGDSAPPPLTLTHSHTTTTHVDARWSSSCGCCCCCCVSRAHKTCVDMLVYVVPAVSRVHARKRICMCFVCCELRSRAVRHTHTAQVDGFSKEIAPRARRHTHTHTRRIDARSTLQRLHRFFRLCVRRDLALHVSLTRCGASAKKSSCARIEKPSCGMCCIHIAHCGVSVCAERSP